MENMRNEEYYLQLLINKEEVIRKKFGQKPHEAIGISEERYKKLKISSRYSRLCEVIKLNSQLVNIPSGGLKGEIDTFRAFLRIATEEQRENINNLLKEVIEDTDRRRKLKEEIEIKRKELKKLEDMFRGS